MPLLLHKSLLLFITLLMAFSLPLKAETNISGLEDAITLLEISPAQSLAITEKYITSRKLVSEQSAQGLSAMGQEKSDKQLRSPTSTIEALQIIARAQFALGNGTDAIKSIEQAEFIAKKFNLALAQYQVRLQKIKLNWGIYANKEQADTMLDALESDFSKTGFKQTIPANFNYSLSILRAQIASSLSLVESADNYFDLAESYLQDINNPKTDIHYAQERGKHNLRFMRFNQALYNLLSAYWSAVEKNYPAQLAKTNYLLAGLYHQRNVYTKALDHYLQAADYYDNYGKSVILSSILNEMAKIYYTQGRYNLALVYYFNVLDGESIEEKLENVIELRLNLAKTYLQLYNFTLTEKYIEEAESLLSFSDYTNLKAMSLLLQAELDNQLSQDNNAVNKALRALEISKKTNSNDLQIESHLLLSAIFKNANKFEEAYTHLHKYNKLTTSNQRRIIGIAEEDFNQQQQFIGKSIHYKNQEELIEKSKSERTKFQYAATGLFFLSSIILILYVRRGILNRRMEARLNGLYQDHYTHPRSGLRNLRLLNVKLPSSLEQSSANFEQWQIGELIHEPLHDKLRFMVIDLPFLRTTYFNEGYAAGLELEKKFGEFIKPKISRPARLYHFSDAMFLYIAPNLNPDQTAKEQFDQFKSWITEFNPGMNIEKTIRAGIADYPFLPKAYTAINDKELIDILLMALGIARKLNLEHGGDHWVNFKAIDNAPAASFAGDNIRNACKDAIDKGLIKIQSSHKFEEGIINFELTD